MENDLKQDPLLKDVAEVEGFKVLEPCVLYSKIGQGGMGAVYRGKHLNLDIDVAVKCLKGSLAADGPSFVARFQREARIAASIHHQNLVQVYDISHKAGVHYLVMEYVMGETARERVKRKGPLKESEACRILLGAALGLAEAHAQRIIHRDVKPDNILISYDGKVKVSDLGLAKALESEDTNTLTNGVMGTPQYMAPEQWADSAHVTPAADIWALGATLYFLLTGENAISGGTMQQVCRRICVDPFPDLRARLPKVSEEVLTILVKCVEKEVRHRYRDGRDLVRDLQRLLAADLTSLADSESGSGKIRDTLVSPPPPQTMARIKVAIDSKLLPTETLAGHAAAGAKGGEENAAPTIVSIEPMQAPSPAKKPVAAPIQRRTRAWVVGLVVLIVVSGFLLIRSAANVKAGNDVALAAAGHPPSQAPQHAESSPAQADHEKPGPDAVRPPPPMPAPTPVGLVLDSAPATGEQLFEKSETFRVLGKVMHKRSDTVRVEFGKDEFMPLSVDSNGAFEGEIPLLVEGPNEIRVSSDGLEKPVELVVVRDSQKPKLKLLAPDPLIPLSTKADIEVRFQLEDANPMKPEFNGGELTEAGANVWTSKVNLGSEGANTFRIQATDRANNIGDPLSFTLLRDTTKPELRSVMPTSGQTLTGGAHVEFAIEFNERIASATIDGQPATIDNFSVRSPSPLPVPFSPRWTIDVRALDLAGNEKQLALEWPVHTEPRLPVKGWNNKGEGMSRDGWARRVEDPKTGVIFVLIEAGTFRMGSPDGVGDADEHPEHDVKITAPFYLAETETTQAQWMKLMNSNPSNAHTDDQLPVEQVSWKMSDEYCRKAGYRLPTEAEWEFACRAGTTLAFNTGSSLRKASANFNDAPNTLPVRNYAPNSWGLFDMHGNVKEWCQDVYDGRFYDGSESVDPLSQSGSTGHVHRGGSYLYRSDLCRCAKRSSNKSVAYDLGFRCALTLPAGP